MKDLTEEEQIDVTRYIMRLLSSWNISPEHQIQLLGLPEETKPRHLSKFKKDTPLPDDEKVFERVMHFIGIADALRTSYPHNAQMGPIWMNQKHRRFAQRTPVQAMIEDDLNGIVAVRVHLDCAFDWQMDEKRAAEVLKSLSSR